MTTAVVATWFSSLVFVFSDWPRWKGQMDLFWQTAALPREACKCILNWIFPGGCLKGLCFERVSWQLGPRQATKITPPHARDLLGRSGGGHTKDCLWTGWKNSGDQVVMAGFIGGMEHTHRENTSWWEHVTLMMTGVLVVSHWRWEEPGSGMWEVLSWLTLPPCVWSQK